MEAAGKALNDRLIVLVTRNEKKEMKRKADSIGVSLAEFVRRSVDAYDPDQDRELEALAALAAEFKRSTESASAAVDRARAEVAETLELLRRKRA